MFDNKKNVMSDDELKDVKAVKVTLILMSFLEY